MIHSQDIWRRFADRPGATLDGIVGIASEHAIGGLLEVIRRHRPRRVLELGAGIGTLTYTILAAADELDFSEFHLSTVETESFCLKQLPLNLTDFAGRYQLLASLDEPKQKAECFDLIVIDGGGDLPNDLGVLDFSGLLAANGGILVDGGRRYQRELIERWYADRDFVYLKSRCLGGDLVIDGIRSKNKPYHLFVFEPSRGERLRLGWRSASNRVLFKIQQRLSRGSGPAKTAGEAQ